MTKKLIELSDKKAYQTEAIKMPNGEKYLNVRQMYKKKGSDVWMPGRGVSLPWQDALAILRTAAELRKDPATKFKKIEKEE